MKTRSTSCHMSFIGFLFSLYHPLSNPSTPLTLSSDERPMMLFVLRRTNGWADRIILPFTPLNLSSSILSQTTFKQPIHPIYLRRSPLHRLSFTPKPPLHILYTFPLLLASTCLLLLLDIAHHSMALPCRSSRMQAGVAVSIPCCKAQDRVLRNQSLILAVY